MNILGIRVDPVTIDHATEKVVEWVKKGGKHYIVTTNVEFIVKAQKDLEFKELLNKSDLSISDSSRLDWAYNIECEKVFLKKLLAWPFFLAPNLLKKHLPTTTGVDLMENLCRVSQERGFTVGLLGGGDSIAEKTKECLLKRYPGLKVSYTLSGGEVNEHGNEIGQVSSSKYQVVSMKGKKIHNTNYILPATDILFVAFGAPKQEKWIIKNMANVDAKVFMGVGGAFDYISGEVIRAPLWLRVLGLEWLFRLLIQPWRIKRFGSLLQFIFLVW